MLRLRLSLWNHTQTVPRLRLNLWNHTQSAPRLRLRLWSHTQSVLRLRLRLWNHTQSVPRLRLRLWNYTQSVFRLRLSLWDYTQSALRLSPWNHTISVLRLRLRLWNHSLTEGQQFHFTTTLTAIQLSTVPPTGDGITIVWEPGQPLIVQPVSTLGQALIVQPVSARGISRPRHDDVAWRRQKRRLTIVLFQKESLVTENKVSQERAWTFWTDVFFHTHAKWIRNVLRRSSICGSETKETEMCLFSEETLIKSLEEWVATKIPRSLTHNVFDRRYRQGCLAPNL